MKKVILLIILICSFLEQSNGQEIQTELKKLRLSFIQDSSLIVKEDLFFLKSDDDTSLKIDTTASEIYNKDDIFYFKNVWFNNRIRNLWCIVDSSRLRLYVYEDGGTITWVHIFSFELEYLGGIRGNGGKLCSGYYLLDRGNNLYKHMIIASIKLEKLNLKQFLELLPQLDLSLHNMQAEEKLKGKIFSFPYLIGK